MNSRRHDGGGCLGVFVAICLAWTAWGFLWATFVAWLGDLWAAAVAAAQVAAEHVVTYCWLAVFPIAVLAIRSPYSCRWMLEQWAHRDAVTMVDPVESAALNLAGRALVAAVPISKVLPQEAVEMAVRRGWVVREGELLKKAESH
jgi:hypothetical protein